MLVGIVGVKPTYGRVSRSGIMPLSWTQDNVGPMTRSVADAALMLGVMAGQDPRDPTSSSAPVPDYFDALQDNLHGLHVGVPEGHYQSGLAPDIESAYHAALRVLEDLGAELCPVTLPTSGELKAVGQLS